MIQFYDLKVSDKPINQTDINVLSVDEEGNPVLDENGKQKFVVKKENPKKKIYTIAHFAIQDTIKFLNEKYNLKLKTYALFGGDSQSYLNKFLTKICNRIDFLNEKYENAIETVFNTPIVYEGKNKYFNLDADTLATKWANKILKIVEKEIYKAIDQNEISGITELQESSYICLSKACLDEILNCINNELTYIFKEMSDARLMINRGESFSEKFNLYPLNTPTPTSKNSGLTI